MRNIRRGRGVALTTWLGYIPEDILNKAPFQVWRGFWQDGLNPKEAMIKVSMDG